MKRQLQVIIIIIALSASSSIILANGKVGPPFDLNLTLKGDETQVIENQNVTLLGDLVIQGDASLKLVNSQIIFTENSGGIWLSGNGRLELENSSVTFNLYSNAGLSATNQSKVVLHNSNIMNKTWCDIHLRYHYHYLVNIFDEASIEATNSSIGTLRLNDNSKAKVENSFIGNLDYNRSDCTITNTTIDIVGFTIQNGSYNCKIRQIKEADNSTSFEISGVPGSIQLKGIKIQYTSFVQSLNSDLTLHDSNIPFIRSDSDTTLLRSTIPQLSAGGNATVEIIDSKVDYLTEGSQGIQRLHVSNSTIGKTEFSLTGEALIESSKIGVWMPSYMLYPNTIRTIRVSDSRFGNFTVDSNTTYVFSNVVIENRTFIIPGFTSFGQTSISGSVEFNGVSPQYGGWYPENIYSVLEREFSVSVQSVGTPLSGVQITLRRGDEVVWSGYSDSSGSVRFNLRFERVRVVDVPGSKPTIDIDNVTTPLNLSVEYGGDSVSRTITLGSGTPIMIGFDALTRTQRETMAGIMVLLLVVAICIVSLRNMSWLRNA